MTPERLKEIRAAAFLESFATAGRTIGPASRLTARQHRRELRQHRRELLAEVKALHGLLLATSALANLHLVANHHPGCAVRTFDPDGLECDCWIADVWRTVGYPPVSGKEAAT